MSLEGYLKKGKKMAELTGLEPAVYGLTGRRVKPTALQLRKNVSRYNSFSGDTPETPNPYLFNGRRNRN